MINQIIQETHHASFRDELESAIVIEAYVKAQEAIHTPKSSATTMKEEFEKIKAEAHAANDEQPQPKGPGN